MHDTSEEMQKWQLAFFMSKTPLERLNMAIEQCNSVKEIVKNTIISENPLISTIELKVKIFERYYKNDFTTEQLADISASIRAYYEKQTDFTH